MASDNLYKTKQVLIVDDEIDICYLVSHLLKTKKNLVSKSVYSIQEASRELENFQPNLVFLDNHLPDGKGIDYIHHVKKQHPDTKVIVISAYDTTHDRTTAINNGADAFISKPFTREVLFNTIENLV